VTKATEFCHQSESVSLLNRRVRFGDTADANIEQDRVVVLASLRFTAKFDGDRKLNLDLTGIHGREMATDAAKVLWEESQPDGHYKSPGGLQDSISAFKRFSDYLAATKQDGHARSLRDITAVHIDGFEVIAHPQGFSP
jgi:hypothetical protein